MLQSLSLPWGTLFFVFLEFLSLAVGEGFFNFSGTRSTHSACVGAYIHPPLPVSMPDATREARRPMGSRFPGLTLTFNGLRQWSRKCFRCKSVVILHKYFCFIICSKWVHPKRTLSITIYCAFIPETTIYCYNTGLSIFVSSGVLFFSGCPLSNLFFQKQPTKLLFDLFQALSRFVLLILCAPPVRGVPSELRVELHRYARVVLVTDSDICK